ncbi:MAG: acyl carrier protein [Candidatus Spyradenecus sp.]
MKTREELFEAIKQILVDEFECEAEAVTPEAQIFQDLDLDSIDAVDLMVRLQRMTGLRVKAEDFKQIRTLGDVLDVVERLLKEQEVQA